MTKVSVVSEGYKVTKPLLRIEPHNYKWTTNTYLIRPLTWKHQIEREIYF